MSEIDRINFVENRDGVEGAISFCKQGMQQYKKALARKTIARPKSGYARDKLYREGFVTSLLEYRKYLKTHSNYY